MIGMLWVVRVSVTLCCRRWSGGGKGRDANWARANHGWVGENGNLRVQGRSIGKKNNASMSSIAAPIPRLVIPLDRSQDLKESSPGMKG
jgi:hypothetical protein